MKVVVSGGFDPLHVGHVDMFREASKLGDLTVIINGDEWLKRKKGKGFMGQYDRAEIIKAIRYVDKVFIYDSDKDDVCGALEMLRPDIFANGGDRTADNIPELETCRKLGIKVLYSVGGGKRRSSSELLDTYNGTIATCESSPKTRT